MERANRNWMRKMAVGIFAAAIFISGCGGGSNGGGSTDGTITTVTLTEIQTNIFTPRCTTACHEPGGEGVDQTQPTSSVPDSVPLDLSTKEAAYDSLVGPDGMGRKSVQSKCGDLDDQLCGLRVAPGDPDGSYIIHKLEGTDVSFATDPMPRNSTPLSQVEISMIRDWIANGALSD